VRFVLCDDHRLFVEPFASALALRGHEVTVTTSPAEAIRAVDEREPDVCVMDLRFPDGESFEAIAELRRAHPSCPVAVLTGSEGVDDLAEAAAAGAAGFLRKGQPVSTLFDALERIATGGDLVMVPRPRSAATSKDTARSRQLIGHLTAREREVLQHLVDAQDTLAIARALGVAPSTARTHLQNVLLKLGVHTRLQAVAVAVEAGIGAEP
jgi:DNA-binding NarL/FixJ family response regulator